MSWDANFMAYQTSANPEIFVPIRPANSMLRKNFSAAEVFSVNKLISLCTAWAGLWHATSLTRERAYDWSAHIFLMDFTSRNLAVGIWGWLDAKCCFGNAVEAVHCFCLACNTSWPEQVDQLELFQWTLLIWQEPESSRNWSLQIS